jgi:hypothetical protein
MTVRRPDIVLKFRNVSKLSKDTVDKLFLLFEAQGIVWSLV